MRECSTAEVIRTLTLPASVCSLDAVLDLMESELRRQLCPLSLQHQLAIAVEELYVNVCHYAYEDTVGNCTITYTFRPEQRQLVFEIVDTGTPFNPLEIQDPKRPASADEAEIGGLGIFMVRNIVDSLSYERVGDANVVRFVKSW